MAAESSISGEAFNVVSKEKTSIRQLAELVSSRLPVEIRYEEGQQGDIAPAEISSEKVASRLGWRAQVPFQEGLNELIDLALAAKRSIRQLPGIL